MNRFAFASSIVLSTMALAACGDDTATSSGSGGGTSASTGDAASSGSPASSNASSASSGTPASSSSGGDGGGDVTSVASSGGGGEGGAPGVGGAGAGGDPGVGGGSGECAPACEAQDFALADEACQNCAVATAQGACGGEAQACLLAGEGPDDVEGCTTCGEIVQGGDPAELCESNQDEAAALLTCVCTVCG